MATDHFDRLARSLVVSPSRRGIVGGLFGVVVGAALSALWPSTGSAKKRKKRCKADEQRCGKKCCGLGRACETGKRGKRKKRKKRCAAVCPPAAGGCGETPCGNSSPGTNCKAAVTTEGEAFCLDFIKANPVACESVCRRSADCGPNGVCLCIDNPPACLPCDGEAGKAGTSCFVRAEVECI